MPLVQSCYSIGWCMNKTPLVCVFTHHLAFSCHIHEHTFFMPMKLSPHVSLNCWWILMGIMPHQWKKFKITYYSLNVNIIIFSICTLLPLRNAMSIQRLDSTDLTLSWPHTTYKIAVSFQTTSHFYLFPYSRKKLEDLRTWMHIV